MKPFNVNLQVRVTDLNYGNHLSHQAVVGLLHEARIHFLKNGSFTEIDISGCGLILSDASYKYKAEGHLGDVLSIAISINNLTNFKFEISYFVYNQTKEKLALQARETFAFLNYKSQKVQPIPINFKQYLDQFLI